jgi:hypothetical protein
LTSTDDAKYGIVKKKKMEGAIVKRFEGLTREG